MSSYSLAFAARTRLGWRLRIPCRLTRTHRDGYVPAGTQERHPNEHQHLRAVHSRAQGCGQSVAGNLASGRRQKGFVQLAR